MKHTGLACAALAALLLVVLPLAADVYNVNLAQVGMSGVTGMATTIVGDISGPTPYHNVEINVRLDKAPPADMVYEGWLVDSKNNVKQSIGAFNGRMLYSRMQLVHFESTSPYEMIAITTEPMHDTNPMPMTVVAQGNLPGMKLSASDFSGKAVLPPEENFHRQAISQRFPVKEEQWNDLRMRSWSYADIAVMSSVASRCDKQPTEIARMLEEGQTWEQIADACNITVAMVFTPIPATAVAGFRAEVGPGMVAPGGMVATPMYYLRFPNGRPVVSQDMWMAWKDRGYSWRDVAVAANIAARTGENVDDLLRMARIQGRTWTTIALERGINVKDAMDVSRWPFGMDGEMMRPMPPATTAPMPGQPGAQPMPAPSRPGY
jgi:hypothetical protein